MHNNHSTLEKMKDATLLALQENRLDNDDLVNFCNFTLWLLNAESLASASRRKGISIPAISKHSEVKIIAGKKFYCEND